MPSARKWSKISAGSPSPTSALPLGYEEETGCNLLDEVIAEYRDYFIEEFDLIAETQRRDSTFIEANIKQLSRIDLIAKVDGGRCRHWLQLRY